MLRNIVDIKQFNKVAFVYNAKAGKQIFGDTRARTIEVANTLRELVGGKRFFEYNIVSFAQVRNIADRIRAEGAEWVIIAGGDGTLRAVVEDFVESAFYPYISIFPSGTVNLVGKELLQTPDPQRWLRRVRKGIATPVWLGMANERVFLTVAGIGVDSLVVDNVGETEKKYLSKFAYVRQGSLLVRRELFKRNWQYKFEVMIDDSGVWMDASSVIVAKSRYYAGRFSLVDGGSLSSPTLHVCLFRGAKKADFLRYAALLATDMLSLDKSVEFIRAKKVEIRSNTEHFAAEIDGDSLVSSPLSISLLEEPIYFIS